MAWEKFKAVQLFSTFFRFTFHFSARKNILQSLDFPENWGI
jgi:hypothetical protein